MNITIINHINPYPELDPHNLPRTLATNKFSYDEPLPAALELADRLREVLTESELRRVVWEAFRDQFMDEIAGDRDSSEYRDAALDVWRDCIR